MFAPEIFERNGRYLRTWAFSKLRSASYIVNLVEMPLENDSVICIAYRHLLPRDPSQLVDILIDIEFL